VRANKQAQIAPINSWSLAVFFTWPLLAPFLYAAESWSAAGLCSGSSRRSMYYALNGLKGRTGRQSKPSLQTIYRFDQVPR
jgi:hypothetical protein